MSNLLVLDGDKKGKTPNQSVINVLKDWLRQAHEGTVQGVILLGNIGESKYMRSAGGSMPDELATHMATLVINDSIKSTTRYEENYDPKLDDPAVTVDLLALVDVYATLEEAQSWTKEQREEAEKWAGAVHLSASDNDDVEVPQRPDFLPDRPMPQDGIWPAVEEGD